MNPEPKSLVSTGKFESKYLSYSNSKIDGLELKASTETKKTDKLKLASKNLNALIALKAQQKALSNSFHSMQHDGEDDRTA